MISCLFGNILTNNMFLANRKNYLVILLILLLIQLFSSTQKSLNYMNDLNSSESFRNYQRLNMKSDLRWEKRKSLILNKKEYSHEILKRQVVTRNKC